MCNNTISSSGPLLIGCLSHVYTDTIHGQIRPCMQYIGNLQWMLQSCEERLTSITDYLAPREFGIPMPNV